MQETNFKDAMRSLALSKRADKDRAPLNVNAKNRSNQKIFVNASARRLQQQFILETEINTL